METVAVALMSSPLKRWASHSLFHPLVRQPRIGHTYHYVHTDRHWTFQPAPVHSSISIHVIKISTQILWLSQWALASLRWHVSTEAATALPRKAWMWSVQLPASVTRRNRKCRRERSDSGKTERKKVSGIPQNWYKSHFVNEISIATRELLQWSHRRQSRKNGYHFELCHSICILQNLQKRLRQLAYGYSCTICVDLKPWKMCSTMHRCLLGELSWISYYG